MIAHTLFRAALVALLAATAAAAAQAQTQIASLASVAGPVEVQRGGQGDWLAAAIGSPVFVADSVRTGPNAFARLLFADDVVVDLGATTSLTIESYAGAKGPRRSLLQLAQGSIEAFVSGYGSEAARWAVETPTAVVRVTSTDFIIRYDATAKATDVVGVEGTVAVQGSTGIIGPGVAVGPSEMTHVPLDGFPSPVKQLDPAQVTTYAQGLRRIGTGTREGLDAGNAIAEGRVVAPTDRPTVGVAAAEPDDGVYLRPGVPGQTLIDSLSPDIRANTQPLPVYRAVPPDASPNPPH
jgi:opacity protein-like surface antigen